VDGVAVGSEAVVVVEPVDAAADGVLVVVVSPPAAGDVGDDAESVLDAAVGVGVDVDGSPPVDEVGVDVGVDVGVGVVPPVEVGFGVVVAPPSEGGVVVGASPSGVGVEVGAAPVGEPLMVDGVDVGVEPPVGPVVGEAPVGPEPVEPLPDPVVAG
jgi:hypothetical protein